MLPEMGAVFDPEELSLLGRIFDQAVAALPGTMQTETNRTEIAKIILGRAAAGELHLTDLMKVFVAISPSRRAPAMPPETTILVHTRGGSRASLSVVPNLTAS